MENSKNNQSDWDSEKQGPRSSNAPRMEPSSQTEDQTPGSGETRLSIPKSESLKTAGYATKSPLIIAVANQKGGVAKTTTVVSLGGALTQLGSEVLLIDLDAQANLTLALGKDPNRVRGSITDVLFHSATLLSVSRETSIPGLDLVPSNTGMELAERFLPVRKDYETILRRTIFDELRRPDSEIPNENAPARISYERNFPVIQYDYVLLDCPPYIGAVTLNALIAADLLIIPTQSEFYSAHALRTMMTTIRQVRAQQNPELVYRILITMQDNRNRIHREIREQIYKTFGEGVFSTIIQIDTRLRESSIDGKPIMYANPRTRSALQYHALAEEIIAYVH